MRFIKYVNKVLLKQCVLYGITRVCHLQKNNFKVKQRNFEICLTFLAFYDIIIM